MPVALCLLLAALGGSTALSRMAETHGWRTVDYAYPSAGERTAAINNRSYIPGNPLPIDIDYFPRDGRQFITTPRLYPGTPASLSVLASPKDYSPLLQPYPSWAWHKEGQCEGLTSVWRVQIDSCGRLWVLDSGVVDSFNTSQRICPPKLVVFNLATNQLITEHRFPAALIKDRSLLVTIVVDLASNSCQDAFAYTADPTTYGLLVFSLMSGRSWRVEHNYFYPDPLWGRYSIQGGEFELMDGVLGLAVSPMLAEGGRRLYFHSLASVREFWVHTSVLQDERNFANGVNSRTQDFFVFDGRRTSQSAAEAMSGDALMFYSQLTNCTVHCWNGWRPFGGASVAVVEQDYERIQFVTSVKVVRGGSGVDELWLLSNRLQKAVTGTMNRSDINVRVLTAYVPSLVRGTVCEIR